MATRTRKSNKTLVSREPAEAKPTRTRNRKAAVKQEEPASNGNGRRTHEDILELVPEIVAKLKDGTTMTDIRAEYGAGPVIRRALAEKGYNTKGERTKVEKIDAESMSDKQLAKAIAELREDGRAWWYIALATDLSQDECKEILEDNGFEALASGRVTVEQEEAEEAKPAKPAAKRSRKAAAKSAEEAEEDSEPAKPAARRRRRKSTEDPSA